MDNLYEVLILDEHLRVDKERNTLKVEEATPKHERLGGQELPVFVKFNETHRSPEGAKVNEKGRLRQFVSMKGEGHADNKSISVKKNCEFKEIERMNISKVPFLPLLSIRTNAIEEVYKEIKEVRQNITEIEERNKVNKQCIDNGKVKIQDLEDRYNRLRKKAGFGCSTEERREEMNNKLKYLQKNWKKTTKKLKKRIQELEEDGKDLAIKADTLRNQIFRRGQQQKVLKKNLNDSGLNNENGHHSCDLLNSSGQLKTVMHTPSWNSLYGN